MTRQAQVVRSSSRSGPAAARELGGGAVIHCLFNSCDQEWTGGGGSAGGIEVAAADPYQRFYVSATIPFVRVTSNGEISPGYVKFSCEGEEISLITVKDQFACLTGVVDLPEGLHLVETLVLPWDFGADVHIDGIAMQIIEGQVVQARGCTPSEGPCA